MQSVTKPSTAATNRKPSMTYCKCLGHLFQILYIAISQINCPCKFNLLQPHAAFPTTFHKKTCRLKTSKLKFDKLNPHFCLTNKAGSYLENLGKPSRHRLRSKCVLDVHNRKCMGN